MFRDFVIGLEDNFSFFIILFKFINFHPGLDLSNAVLKSVY